MPGFGNVPGNASHASQNASMNNGALTLAAFMHIFKSASAQLAEELGDTFALTAAPKNRLKCWTVPAKAAFSTTSRVQYSCA